jgi:small subunit ribosomal protein S1
MTNRQDDLASLLANVNQVAEPQRGDLLHGFVLSMDSEGLIVDLGLKRDGIVPCADLDKLPPEESPPNVGEKVAVMVIDPLDRDGNLVVSIAQARESDDWLKAHSLMESETIVEIEPISFNKGGLIVPFGRLRGFVPASHLSELPRGLEEDMRADYLREMVGTKMPFRVIEVDPRRRRLVLSERKAVRQWRQDRKAELIQQLKEGEVRKGVVTSLREFGAFVDIGGADGLIHISELCWTRVEDPAKVLSLGQEVETQIIRLDPQANRIGLSLKRLQPNPWDDAVERLEEGTVVTGTVTHLAAAGVYVLLGEGPEGLVRSSDGTGFLSLGSSVQVKIVTFDPERERLELELIESNGFSPEVVDGEELENENGKGGET